MKSSGSLAACGFLSVVGCLLIAPPVSAQGVAVVSTVVSDNGDHDGYADTQETVTLQLVVRNTSGADLSGVTARLATTDGSIACLTRPLISIGDLAAGEERTTVEGFEFVVLPDVERTNVLEDLSVRFALTIWTPEQGLLDRATWIDLDLDLNVSGGAGPTVFFEGFEDGFGTFTTMHLDEGLNPPDSDLANNSAGVLNADGWRCQYSDPEWENAVSYGTTGAEGCFPNASYAPDQFYFSIVTDRAFTGTQSMGYNIFLGPARGYTTPIGQLEAVRTINPVNLGRDRVCSTSRSTGCSDESGCPPGESCEWARPQLSFKHQISLVDHRSISAIDPGRGGERAVVSVQLADAEGEGVGSWIKLYPFVNIYDTQANSNFFHCSFDPADDGNTEEIFFDPTDPQRFLGPSSTCAPELSFAHQGDTDDPFSSGNVGNGASGSGLEGTHGIGTWVEPVFDLSRFRGRRIRARLLQTGITYGGAISWDPFIIDNPDSGDDGWFIDDVKVTDALADAATVVVDDQDNSALPIDIGSDVDMDGIAEVCDNCSQLGNADQSDRDLDGVGDACDPCPDDPLDDLDGDGLCAPVDNCPAYANDNQGDFDYDGVGDACDNCQKANPFQELDEDDDGIECAVDNCYQDANSAQTDEDGDGLGDVCDVCPQDSLNDPDGDRICGLEDNCPFARNSEWGTGTELARSGNEFLLSPDGSTVVFRRRGGALDRIPVTGGGSTTLSNIVPDTFAITPDSSTVVFNDNYDDAAGNRGLYTIPVQGGTPTRLSAEGDDVSRFWLSPGGSRVAYLNPVGDPGSTSLEVFSVSVLGGPRVMLSAPAIPGADAGSVQFSPDGSLVSFRRQNTDLFSVAVDGGPVLPLASTPTAQIDVTQFSPDGTRIVFTREGGLFSVPVDGTQAPTDLGAGSSGFRISPDGATVLYADGDLFQVPIDGGPSVSIGPEAPHSHNVLTFEFTPDGSHIVFTALNLITGDYELHVASDGGGSIQLLAEAREFAIAPDSSRVAYGTLSPTKSVFVAPISGGHATRLFEGLSTNTPISDLRISVDGSRVFHEYGAALYGNLIEGGAGVLLGDSNSIPQITHDGSAVVWREWTGRLYASWFDPDPDADGIHRACDCDEAYAGGIEIHDGLDNQCPGGDGFGLVDELAGPSGFTDPLDPDRYSWTPQLNVTEYEVVRAVDPGFTEGCSCASVFANYVSIAEEPPEGVTYFYLPRTLAPHLGSPGADSEGNERSGACLMEGCGS